MKILILGGDGYLGWPTAMYLSRKGHTVAVLDNFNKRKWEMEIGVKPLVPVATLHERIKTWKEVSGKDTQLYVGDLCDGRFVSKVFEELIPDPFVHSGNQPSPPSPMMAARKAVKTQTKTSVAL